MAVGDGGGTAEFAAPLALSRAIMVMDLNLATPTHRFVILERTADETQAVFKIGDQDGEYEGTVVLTPMGEATRITVELNSR